MKNNPDWYQHATELVDIYKDDLPSRENLDMELLFWQSRWNNHNEHLPTKLQATLDHCDKNYFPLCAHYQSLAVRVNVVLVALNA